MGTGDLQKPIYFVLHSPFPNLTLVHQTPATKTPVGIYKPTRRLFNFSLSKPYPFILPSWTLPRPAGFRLMPFPKTALPSPSLRLPLPCCLRISLLLSTSNVQGEFTTLFICWGVSVYMCESFLSPPRDYRLLTTRLCLNHNCSPSTQISNCRIVGAQKMLVK